MLNTWKVLDLFLVAILVPCVSGTSRGPLCLDDTRVRSPPTTVRECWPWESCFASRHINTEGSQHFDYGCRPTQECLTNSNGDPQKRADLNVCDDCCWGDVCNVDTCANETVPDRGLPCLHCASVVSILSCTKLTYCKQGEVCFTQLSQSGPHPTFSMGCLRKDVCSYFEEQTVPVGKRSAMSDEVSLCHKCCEHPMCNRDACFELEVSTPPAQTTTTASVTTSPATLPAARDCWDLRHIYNMTTDGIYTVLSPSGNNVVVRCDMTTDGGGWVVFQRRHSATAGHQVDFDRTYSEYRVGFGAVSGEFWMGNEGIHEFSKDELQRLRVDLCDWGHAHRYAEYDFFMVGADADNYRLSVAVYNGSAGDALITGLGVNEYHNNMQFSTSDVDHDDSFLKHCGERFHAGWWFGDCFSANLNGVYHNGFINGGQGIQWRPWIEDYSLMSSEMKFRPSHVIGDFQREFSCR